LAFDVAIAPATISFSGTPLFGFDGLAKPATAVTTPPGLPVSLTYNGGATVPNRPGVYTVVGTVTDPNYVGSSTLTLTINPPPPPTINLQILPTTQGNPPFNVTFQDASSGFIDSWTLVPAADGNPTFTNRSQPIGVTYSQPGSHEAVLTVVGPGGTVQKKVQIKVNPLPILATIQNVSGPEDQVLSLNLAGIDPLAGTWSLGGVDANLFASTNIAGDAVTLTPVANASGADVVQVTRTNGFGLTASQDVTLTLTPVDDPPSLDPVLPASFTAAEDVQLVVSGVGHIKDIDTDLSTLQMSASGFDNKLVAAAVGSANNVVFTPHPNAFGKTAATIHLVDPAANIEITQAVQLEWTPVNDPPDVPLALIPAGGAVSVPLTPLISWGAKDVDGDALKSDFYLGPNGTPPLLLAANIAEMSFAPGELQPASGYAWRVVVRDPSGATNEASYNFSTERDLRPPRISDVLAGATEAVATVTWLTDELATSFVRFGPAGTLNADNGGVDDSGLNLVLQHSVTLNGLTAGTLYDFEITTTDGAGNPAATSGQWFTLAAKDMTAPEISGERVEGITQESAVVRWKSSELSTSRVRYAEAGTDLAAGMALAPTTDLVEDHQGRLTGLKAATT